MTPPPRRYLVLLAEDNPGDVYLVREALREHGLDVDLQVFDDGEKVFALIELTAGDPSRPVPDLILLDLNLPKRVGHEVLGKVRSTKCMEHVPVLLLSSSESPQDKETARTLGATGYFQKPTSLDDFLKLGKVARDCLQGKVPSADSSGN